MTVPVIIDTDPGVDDAVALLLAAASPELELLAITTVFGNVGLETVTDNALRLRALAELGRVPVAAGADRPLVHPQVDRADRWHATDGLGGCAGELPEPDGPVNARGAVALMADLLATASSPVTLVAIGPLTNIALLLAAHPEVKPRIGRIVAMGGELSGADSATAAHSMAEFNLHCDPEAARRVLVEEDVATTLVPCDLTLRCAVDGPWLDALAAAGPRCAVLGRVIRHYHSRFRESSGRDEVPLHDPLAVLEAAVPGTLHATALPLEVVCDHGPARGVVLADRSRGDGGRLVDVALDADVGAVHDTILKRLRSLG